MIESLVEKAWPPTRRARRKRSRSSTSEAQGANSRLHKAREAKSEGYERGSHERLANECSGLQMSNG